MLLKLESNLENLMIIEFMLLKFVTDFFRVSPEGVDLFLDCVCGEECSRGYSLLKPMGKYILFGKYKFSSFIFYCFAKLLNVSSTFYNIKKIF